MYVPYVELVKRVVIPERQNIFLVAGEWLEKISDSFIENVGQLSILEDEHPNKHVELKLESTLLDMLEFHLNANAITLSSEYELETTVSISQAIMDLFTPRDPEHLIGLADIYPDPRTFLIEYLVADHGMDELDCEKVIDLVDYEFMSVVLRLAREEIDKTMVIPDTEPFNKHNHDRLKLYHQIKNNEHVQYDFDTGLQLGMSFDDYFTNWGEKVSKQEYAAIYCYSALCAGLSFEDASTGIEDRLNHHFNDYQLVKSVATSIKQEILDAYDRE